MPYNAEFRKQVLETISNLHSSGQLYNRKRHTLEHVINSYLAQATTKHSMLGTTILEKMHYQVKHIFNNARDTTPLLKT
jgi:hypothetical protein